MAVEPLSGPSSSKPSEGVGPSASEGLPVDLKTGEVAEASFEGVGAEAPELTALSQHEFTVVEKLLPTDLSPEVVGDAVSSILEEQGITEGADPGIEVIAIQHINENFNTLLEIGGYPPLCPEYDVQSFDRVDIIFSESGVTLAGIESEELPDFLEKVRDSNPELAAQLVEFSNDDALACVSSEMVAATEQMADDRFSELASELRDILLAREELEEPSEKEEVEELEEPEGGEEEGVATEEAEVSEGEESEITDVEEASESETEEETGENPPAQPITRTSLEAALVGKVAETILRRIALKGIVTDEMRAARHYREERAQEKKEAAEQAKEKREKEDVQRDEKERAIRKDEEKRYEQKKEALSKKRKASQNLRDSRTIETKQALGEYQEKKKAGEPTSQPSPPPAS